LKPINAGLLAYLDEPHGTSAFGGFIADLYTITLTDGTVYTLTSADQPITLTRPAFPGDSGSGNVTFNSGGPSALPDKNGQSLKWGIGTEVDSCSFRLIVSPSNLIESVELLYAFATGMIDQAMFQLERVFMPTFGDTSLGSVPLLLGNVADITEVSRISATFNVKDRRELLNIPMPYRMYEPGCGWVLYGPGCLAVKSSFGFNGIVMAGSNSQQVFLNLSNVTGAFSEGLLLFTSGLNSGKQVPVKYSVQGAIATATLNAAGSGYSINDLLSITGGGGTLALIQVNTVGVGGSVATYTLVGNGTGYATTTGAAVTGGSGHGATFNITAGNLLAMFLPLGNTPSAGDTATAYLGCDHTLTTCTNVFANSINFGGFPFIPVPETAA
jgi:hypothetical protein